MLVEFLTLRMMGTKSSEYDPHAGVMPPVEVRVLDSKWEKMVISAKGIRWQVRSVNGLCTCLFCHQCLLY